jgi:hypothetical protein
MTAVLRIVTVTSEKTIFIGRSVFRMCVVY